MGMSKQLDALIRRFLSTIVRRKDGGWPEVKEDDFSQLHGIIHSLIAHKWGVDEDGDIPVQYLLANRTAHESLPFIPARAVPFDSNDRQIDLECLRTACTNLSIAEKNLDTVMKIFLLNERERKLKEDGSSNAASKKAT
jgi:hypothetical protein